MEQTRHKSQPNDETNPIYTIYFVDLLKSKTNKS